MADQPTVQIEVPKPLPCRIAELLKEWKQVRDDFKKKGNDEAVIAVECCAENLHEVLTAFFNDVKAWRAKQQL